MSARYTLRLTTNGAEVWKRWTGDRDEAARIAAAGLVDIGKDESLQAHMLMEFIKNPSGAVDGMTVYSTGMTSALHLNIRQKG